MDAHTQLGHCHEDAVQVLAKNLGIELKPGSLGICVSCSKAKAKQKNVLVHDPKREGPPTEQDMKRAFLDISTIKNSLNPKQKKHWRIVVLGGINLKFSDFHATKNAMVEPTCEHLHQWKQAGRGIEIIRCDNAGENEKLQERVGSADWKLDIEFEYMA